MNILIHVTRENYIRYLVTINSLIVNNSNILFYILRDNLSDKMFDIVKCFILNNCAEIGLVIDYKPKDNYPQIVNILSELPSYLDRLLYISDDSIILGNIFDFYNQDFGQGLIVARSQNYDITKRRVGERPEKGQLFDKRIVLYNINDIRKLNYDSIISNMTSYYGVINNEQGVLNCFFKNDVKYESRIEYNFRYSIFTEAEKKNCNILDITPLIISFEQRDYFDLDTNFMPWEIILSYDEVLLLESQCVSKVIYAKRLSKEVSCKIFHLWKGYLQGTGIEQAIIKCIDENRDRLFERCSDRTEVAHAKAKLVDTYKHIDTLNFFELSHILYQNILEYMDSISPDNAVTLMNRIFSINCKRISKSNKVKVGFVIYSSSEWQCESLCQMLEKDVRFSTYFLICKQALGNVKIENEIYETTKDAFKRRRNVLFVSENEDKYKKIVNEMDILCLFAPWPVMPEYLDVLNRPITQLCIHIPYGIYVENKDDLRYPDGSYFEMPFFRVLWRFYSSSMSDFVYAEKKQQMKGYNIRVSGFPKIDSFLKTEYKIRSGIWKSEKKAKLKVIWAPHFNMEKGMNGTFYENYMWFYRFALENREISWVVKPHPRIKAGALRAGVFADKEEFDDYLEKWKNLENANVIENGDYYDIFETSDALILDSLSFVAEYQYTGKPLLFLLSEEPRKMNELGDKIMSVSYKVRGNDFEGIEKFIGLCLDGKDYLKEARREIMSQNLDYVSFNGMYASDYIYKDILQEIFGNV